MQSLLNGLIRKVGITQNIYSPSTDSGNSSDSESFSSEDNQYFNDLPANYLDYSRAKLLPDQSGEVQIPSGTEKIGYRAFNGLDITSVTIPDSVTVIESMAFRNNSRLTEINFGQSITHIGTNAFANTAIQTVALPNSVKHIGSNAFANAENRAGLSWRFSRVHWRQCICRSKY
jgi:hypothetical protein